MDFKDKQVSLSSEEISPRILHSAMFLDGMNFPSGYRLEERYVYDYELEFFVDSKGSMFIDGRHYDIAKGDIVFRRPGQTTQGIMPYSCYLVCFDLTGSTKKNRGNYDFLKEQEFQYNYKNSILDLIPHVFHPLSTEKYENLFDSILKEFIKSEDASRILLKSHILQILFNLYNDVNNTLDGALTLNTPYYNIIKKSIKYIEENFNKNINLNLLGQISDFSPNHFHKIFKKSIGITPNEYITKFRLEKAKEMLVSSNLAVYEIAVKCGFENIPYFSYIFKKHVGLTAIEFKKKHSYI